MDNQIAEVGGTKIPYTCTKVILIGTPWYDCIYPNIQILKCNVVSQMMIGTIIYILCSNDIQRVFFKMNLQFLLWIHSTMDLSTKKGKLETNFIANANSFKS